MLRGLRKILETVRVLPFLPMPFSAFSWSTVCFSGVTGEDTGTWGGNCPTQPGLSQPSTMEHKCVL